MKNDGLFRDGVGQAPADESQAAGSSHCGRRGLSTLVRTLVLIVALAAAGLVLYRILQVFVCDFREVVFKHAEVSGCAGDRKGSSALVMAAAV
jgi:hypothetical protein